MLFWEFYLVFKYDDVLIDDVASLWESCQSISFRIRTCWTEFYMPVELDELVWHLCLKRAVRVVGGEAASNEPKQPSVVS